jgi:hypothetical protein
MIPLYNFGEEVLTFSTGYMTTLKTFVKMFQHGQNNLKFSLYFFVSNGGLFWLNTIYFRKYKCIN